MKTQALFLGTLHGKSGPSFCTSQRQQYFQRDHLPFKAFMVTTQSKLHSK